jgi:hypothetical protein
MANDRVRLASITLPDFGLPYSQPAIRQAEYENRIETARARAVRAELDFLLVYGDREHFANLAYLTDHDPRFEEALLVIPSAGGKPILILGNEGLTYSELIAVEVERTLYQGFSLPGQKRSDSPRLEPVLRDCGLQRGSRVGLVGWKYATPEESDDPEHWLDGPAFIVDPLRRLTGDANWVTNATAIFMNPVDGLRTNNSVDQLAAFEFAATHGSQAVRNLIEHLQPGLTELEAVQNMRLNGLPLSAHLMFSSGPRARLGLPSPSSRLIKREDPFFVACGLRGGLTARAGWVAAEPSELREAGANYLERLVKPYFAAAVAWYEHVGIGVKGGEIQTVVEDALAGHDIGIALNPGHLIHLDEWVHSPAYAGSEVQLRSGMLIQCDIIPVVEPKYHTTNVEDTIALADQPLRDQLASTYPEVWQRVQVRRTFMRDVLGIHLKPEVLPFSNMAAMLQPFVLNPHLVIVATG